ncbi:MAG: RNA polymerase sigma factor [Deltaproteobacteria bacterium]|nr:RNA polymerase sigma factor [Deltaproteobacteria bacterium]
MSTRIEALEESRIIRQVLQGRVEDFEILLQRYQARVFQVVSGHVPPGVVSEVAGEVFVRAYLALPEYEARSTFDRWLTGIAVRCCCDYWRKHYRSRERAVGSLSEDQRAWFKQALADQADEAFRQVRSQEEARELIDLALAGLSAEDRMVINLVYLEELPLKEAARLLGWTIIKVKVRAYRAKAKMRQRLAELFGKESGR